MEGNWGKRGQALEKWGRKVRRICRQKNNGKAATLSIDCIGAEVSARHRQPDGD